MKLSKYKEKRNIILADLNDYYQACNGLAFEFQEKYFGKEYNTYPDWIGDKIGQVLIINDYFFDVSDIITALENNVTRKKLFEWYDYHIDSYETGKEVNFNNYIKGAR